MKEFTKYLLSLFLASQFIACVSNCSFREADVQKFSNLVSSKSYQDRLRHNILTVGMPYFVISDIQGDCPFERFVVASIGSSQELLESEGISRVYHDTSLKIYLNIYNTSKGKLNVWFGNFTFYTLEVSKNDLIIFYNAERTDTARILYLINPRKLRINKALDYGSIQYSEIIHKEKDGKVSFWYNLSVNDSNVVINQKGFDFYPIYRIELNNKEVKSFRFKQ